MRPSESVQQSPEPKSRWQPMLDSVVQRSAIRAQVCAAAIPRPIPQLTQCLQVQLTMMLRLVTVQMTSSGNVSPVRLRTQSTRIPAGAVERALPEAGSRGRTSGGTLPASASSREGRLLLGHVPLATRGEATRGTTRARTAQRREHLYVSFTYQRRRYCARPPTSRPPRGIASVARSCAG